MVDVAFSILATHQDFSHVAHVEYAAVLAYSLMFVDDVSVLYWHVKTAEGRNQGSQSNMFVVETGFFIFHNYRGVRFGRGSRER